DHSRVRPKIERDLFGVFFRVDRLPLHEGDRLTGKRLDRGRPALRRRLEHGGNRELDGGNLVKRSQRGSEPDRRRHGARKHPLLAGSGETPPYEIGIDLGHDEWPALGPAGVWGAVDREGTPGSDWIEQVLRERSIVAEESDLDAFELARGRDIHAQA